MNITAVDLVSTHFVHLKRNVGDEGFRERERASWGEKIFEKGFFKNKKYKYIDS